MVNATQHRRNKTHLLTACTHPLYSLGVFTSQARLFLEFPKKNIRLDSIPYAADDSYRRE